MEDEEVIEDKYNFVYNTLLKASEEKGFLVYQGGVEKKVTIYGVNIELSFPDMTYKGNRVMKPSQAARLRKAMEDREEGKSLEAVHDMCIKYKFKPDPPKPPTTEYVKQGGGKGISVGRLKIDPVALFLIVFIIFPSATALGIGLASVVGRFI